MIAVKVALLVYAARVFCSNQESQVSILSLPSDVITNVASTLGGTSRALLLLALHTPSDTVHELTARLMPANVVTACAFVATLDRWLPQRYIPLYAHALGRSAAVSLFAALDGPGAVRRWSVDSTAPFQSLLANARFARAYDDAQLETCLNMLEAAAVYNVAARVGAIVPISETVVFQIAIAVIRTNRGRVVPLLWSMPLTARCLKHILALFPEPLPPVLVSMLTAIPTHKSPVHYAVAAARIHRWDAYVLIHDAHHKDMDHASIDRIHRIHYRRAAAARLSMPVGWMDAEASERHLAALINQGEQGRARVFFESLASNPEHILTCMYWAVFGLRHRTLLSERVVRSARPSVMLAGIFLASSRTSMVHMHKAFHRIARKLMRVHGAQWTVAARVAYNLRHFYLAHAINVTLPRAQRLTTFHGYHIYHRDAVIIAREYGFFTSGDPIVDVDAAEILTRTLTSASLVSETARDFLQRQVPSDAME